MFDLRADEQRDDGLSCLKVLLGSLPIGCIKLPSVVLNYRYSSLKVGALLSVDSQRLKKYTNNTRSVTKANSETEKSVKC
jgi:hypothetical protein